MKLKNIFVPGFNEHLSTILFLTKISCVCPTHFVHRHFVKMIENIVLDHHQHYIFRPECLFIYCKNFFFSLKKKKKLP